jgi:hypothetical protein
MKRELDEGQLRSDLVQIFRIRVPDESEHEPEPVRQDSDPAARAG